MISVDTPRIIRSTRSSANSNSSNPNGIPTKALSDRCLTSGHWMNWRNRTDCTICGRIPSAVATIEAVRASVTVTINGTASRANPKPEIVCMAQAKSTITASTASSSPDTSATLDSVEVGPGTGARRSAGSQSTVP